VCECEGERKREKARKGRFSLCSVNNSKIIPTFLETDSVLRRKLSQPPPRHDGERILGREQIFKFGHQVE